MQTKSSQNVNENYTVMDKSLMLSEIRDYAGIEKDSDFAKFLGIKANTLANWRARNSFDAELIVAKCEFVDPKWLLTGKGSMLVHGEETKPVAENLDLQAMDLLQEKERFIQYLLKEGESNQKNIAALETKLQVLTSKLEAAMEVIDIEKSKNGIHNSQLKNEEKAGNDK